VIERIKKLEESGIIVGYRALIDARKLGTTSAPSSAC
jgi:DNA-binding Lrp family transcriptional regulator